MPRWPLDCSIANSRFDFGIRLCALVVVRFGGEIIVRVTICCNGLQFEIATKLYTGKVRALREQIHGPSALHSRTISTPSRNPIARLVSEEKNNLHWDFRFGRREYRAAFTTRVIIPRGKALRDICTRIFPRFENAKFP